EAAVINGAPKVDVTTFLMTWVPKVGGWLAVGGAAFAVLKWSAEKWLERRLQSSKARLDERVESHKAELVRLGDQLRHGLEREMLKAQLATSKAHEVYPRLYEKIARAQGAVAGFVGFEFAPSYQDYDADDFTQVLEAAKLPRGERTRIFEAIQADRRRGVEELQRVMRRVR